MKKSLFEIFFCLFSWNDSGQWFDSKEGKNSLQSLLARMQLCLVDGSMASCSSLISEWKESEHLSDNNEFIGGAWIGWEIKAFTKLYCIIKLSIDKDFFRLSSFYLNLSVILNVMFLSSYFSLVFFCISQKKFYFLFTFTALKIIMKLKLNFKF